MVDTLINFVFALYWVYTILIFTYIIMGWLRLLYNIWIGRLRGFLHDTVEPYLRLFRRVIPPIGGMDLSPILALIVLRLVFTITVTILDQLQ
jgi:YggT family protein